MAADFARVSAARDRRASAWTAKHAAAPSCSSAKTSARARAIRRPDCRPSRPACGLAAPRRGPAGVAAAAGAVDVVVGRVSLGVVAVIGLGQPEAPSGRTWVIILPVFSLARPPRRIFGDLPLGRAVDEDGRSGRTGRGRRTGRRRRSGRPASSSGRAAGHRADLRRRSPARPRNGRGLLVTSR